MIGFTVQCISKYVCKKNIASPYITSYHYMYIYYQLLANWTFSLWCVPLIKTGSLNWPTVRYSHAQGYRSIWRKTHYDFSAKNNNVSSEGLDRLYHKYPSSSCRTRWDISDNVCLDLQNCCYSIFNMKKNNFLYVIKIQTSRAFY